MLLLLFAAAASSLALSSARASQKALCVSRLSFLHAINNLESLCFNYFVSC
uniref:Uncharacterized protein n=1 Tax=Oryza brachyantha TaxID=4533 RepID=J3N2Q3_ORYBR